MAYVISITMWHLKIDLKSDEMLSVLLFCFCFSFRPAILEYFRIYGMYDTIVDFHHICALHSWLKKLNNFVVIQRENHGTDQGTVSI